MQKYIIKTCLECKQKFNAPKVELNRGRAKFCSRSCSSKYHNKKRWTNSRQPNVTCAYCNKQFYKKLSSQKKSKSGLFFCSKNHKDKAVLVINEIRPAHYDTSKFRYRKKALEHYPNYCNRCKFDKIFVVHHKDRNRKNNDLKNLEILCLNCHALEHLEPL